MMAAHVLKIADPSVHRDILTFLQLKAFPAAGIYRAVGMNSGMIDKDDILLYTFPLATVYFDELSVHHHDIGAGRSGNIAGGMGEESQRKEKVSYDKGRLFHIGVLGYRVIRYKNGSNFGYSIPVVGFLQFFASTALRQIPL